MGWRTKRELLLFARGQRGRASPAFLGPGSRLGLSAVLAFLSCPWWVLHEEWPTLVGGETFPFSPFPHHSQVPNNPKLNFLLVTSGGGKGLTLRVFPSPPVTLRMPMTHSRSAHLLYPPPARRARARLSAQTPGRARPPSFLRLSSRGRRRGGSAGPAPSPARPPRAAETRPRLSARRARAAVRKGSLPGPAAAARFAQLPGPLRARAPALRPFGCALSEGARPALSRRRPLPSPRPLLPPPW